MIKNTLTDNELIERYIVLLDILNFDYRSNSSFVNYRYDSKKFKTICFSSKRNNINKSILRHINTDPTKTKISSIKKNNFEFLQLIEKLKDGNLALKEFNETYILTIDLDFHQEKEEIINNIKDKKLIKIEVEKKANSIIESLNVILETEPLLIEKSKIGAGYHIYYMSENIVNDNLKYSILNYIQNKHNKTLEFRTQTKALRIPFARDYKLIGSKSNQSIEEQLNIIFNKYKNYKKFNINDAILNIRKEELQNNATIEQKEIQISKRKNDFSKPFLSFENYCKQNYNMIEGNRIGGQKIMFSMAFSAIHHKINENDYVKSILNNPGTSKDLNKWNEQKIICESKKIYQWCKQKYEQQTYLDKKRTDITNKYESEKYIFHSNIDLLTCKHKRVIKKLTYDINQKNKCIYQKNNEKQKEAIHIMLNEIIGQFFYDYKNPKVINNQLPLSFAIKKKLQNSTYFSQQWLALLKEHYKLTNINIKNIFDICISYFISNNIISLSLKNVNFNNFSYCNQYNLFLNRLLYIYSNYKNSMREKEIYLYALKFYKWINGFNGLDYVIDRKRSYEFMTMFGFSYFNHECRGYDRI